MRDGRSRTLDAAVNNIVDGAVTTTTTSQSLSGALEFFSNLFVILGDAWIRLGSTSSPFQATRDLFGTIQQQAMPSVPINTELANVNEQTRLDARSHAVDASVVLGDVHTERRIIHTPQPDGPATSSQLPAPTDPRSLSLVSSIRKRKPGPFNLQLPNFSPAFPLPSMTLGED
ncbi:hypothetical protein H0H81_010753 [Sphagnurus paluster]|uniref:Uncharacterized protein n=1 Tax=Sphagnurus paluster TaxID=117069 RepID=A0A9P7FNF0_9AGAR|nr:hypothetical protein H0H81_010753 [Sphagnurus paluster]